MITKAKKYSGVLLTIISCNIIGIHGTQGHCHGISPITRIIQSMFGLTMGTKLSHILREWGAACQGQTALETWLGGKRMEEGEVGVSTQGTT